MSDLCVDSSISSFNSGPEISCETPEINHISPESVFSRANPNPCSSGSVFPEVHGRMTNGDNFISNSVPISYHPEHQRLLDALSFMSQHQTPIDHAYFIGCINDYLKEVITKKENKLKKRALNESFASNATSIVNNKFQAIQDHYQSFYGSNSTLNRIQPNLTDHSFVAPYHNGSILPVINPDRNNRVQSSFINTSRNNFSAVPTNNVGRPQKFSKLEDTLVSVRCNGESLVQNNSLFNFPKPSTRASSSLNTSGLRSSFFTKSRNNLSSFQADNSAHTVINGDNDVGRPNETVEDQFSCVRVVMNKAQLPPIIEEQQQREDSNESNASTSPCSSQDSTVKNFSKKNPLPNDQFSLKNWTVLLRDKALCLKGTKLIGERIVEKAHTSDEIAYRLRNGQIKTKDKLLYKLIDPFITNEEMPPKVKTFFRNNKFPLNWRVALKAWMDELKNRKLKEVESKTKPCHVVLECNGVSKNLKNSKVEKKNEKAQDKEEKKRITKKSPAGKKCNEASTSKDTPPPKVKKTNKNSEQTSVNESCRKKSKVKTKEKSHVKKKETDRTAKSNKAQAKHKDIHKGKSKESNPQKKRKENCPTQKNDDSLENEIETEDVNCDLFGEILKTPLNRERNVCTPTALLNSIKKHVPKQVGRSTPPLQIMSDFIEKKKTLSLSDISIACGSKENPVIKRMAKTKGVKKISKKENPLEGSEDDEINQILATLTNKSPQTTPKAIKQVFRKNEDSDDTSDFGSDVSSISS